MQRTLLRSEAQLMKTFSGVYVRSGTICRLTFEAESVEAAKQLAEAWQIGVGEEVASQGSPIRPLTPQAYNVEDTCRLLGNLGKSTIWKWLKEGKLERVPGTRRALVTRRSIEKLAHNW